MRYTIRKLKQLAKEQKIKYYSNMNSKTLCEALGLPYERCAWFDTHIKDKISKPVKIIGVNTATGEEVVEFPSINKTAKFFFMNPRYVYVYIEEKKEVKFQGEKIVLRKKN